MQIHKTLSISDLYIPKIYRFNIRLFLGMNKYWYIKEFLPSELQPFPLITDVNILHVISMNEFFKDKKTFYLLLNVDPKMNSLLHSCDIWVDL